MAPNKKKKKPASNPARGFATTSIVSKNKIEDNVAVEEPITAETSSSGPVQPASPAFKYGLNSEKQLHELSPDQLEKQLEESELQLLVEKHAEKSKKDSSRYVSKLQTERRLLRLHALPLDTWRWLPEETLKQIVEFSDQDNPYNQPSDEIANKKGFSGATSDELSIRIWTLRRALVELGFLQGRIDEAIAYLLQNQKAIQHANEVAGRDGVWGIDDCLDWLALKCTGEEVPDYETKLIVTRKSHQLPLD
jgi:ATP-dependent RNA helicase DHX29